MSDVHQGAGGISTLVFSLPSLGEWPGRARSRTRPAPNFGAAFRITILWPAPCCRRPGCAIMLFVRGRRLPWSIVAVAGGCGTLCAALAAAFRPADQGYVQGRILVALALVPFFAVSTYLFVRRPRHVVARLLLVCGSAFGVFTGLGGVIALLQEWRGSVPALWLLLAATQWAYLAANVGLAGALAVFPAAEVRESAQRAALWIFTVVAAVVPPLLLVSSRQLDMDLLVFRPKPSGTSPFYIEAVSWLEPFTRLLFDASDGFVVVGVLMLLRRRRRASPRERAQMRWLTAAGLVFGLVAVIQVLLAASGWVSSATTALAPCAALFPAAMTVGILRHHLLDIDVVIRRTLIYGALILLIGFIYAGMATALGITASARLPVGAAVATAVLTTIALQPVRTRLERAADRWVFGERLTGYELLNQVGATLEHAYDVKELAPRLAAAIQAGLGLRWARISPCLHADAPEVLEPVGAGVGLDDEVVSHVTVPLIHKGEKVGVLECGAREGTELREPDREALATLARQVALALHNAQLAAELAGRLDEIRRQADELAASRTRIVQAQDSERRRIERDLHDGVQQDIVALITKARLARNQLLRSDPVTTTDATLNELQEHARLLLGELRELAHGIHPPVLTDRGLLEAVEARLDRLPLEVLVDGDTELRSARFPEDIEAAAFFFVSESLANVMRHADAERIEMKLAKHRGRLVVEVADDGVGFTPEHVSGAGIANIRDRIQAVGGHFSVSSQPGRGTRVRAELPGKERQPSGASSPDR